MAEDQELKLAVCRDVIAQLDAGFCPTPGKYLTVYRDDLTPAEMELPANLAPAAIGQRECKACAVGTMFLARMGIMGKSFRDALVPYGGGRSYLANNLPFSVLELALIESAFEYVGDFARNYGKYELPDPVWTAWVATYPHPRDRLRAIMQNVLRNGSFRPEEVLPPEPAKLPAMQTTTVVATEEATPKQAAKVTL